MRKIIRAQQVMEIEELQDALEQMHKSMAEKVSRNRQQQIDVDNRRTNLIEPNFADFVLVRRATKKGQKLKFRWISLRRITRLIAETVYEVAGLLQNDTEVVHAARLIMYRTNLFHKA